MRILAIDPGTAKSAWVIWDSEARQVAARGHDDNAEMLRMVSCPEVCIDAGGENLDALAVEMVQSFGMAVGAEVFETVYWIGRFCQAWAPRPFERVYRMEVKMHLCNHPRAKDPNIRQALIDRFGAPGTKKNQGATYGLAGDMWSALGVAVTFAETKQQKIA